jgi:hypothetical protein
MISSRSESAPEDVPALDPSANDMVQGIGCIDAGFAWHE